MAGEGLRVLYLMCCIGDDSQANQGCVRNTISVRGWRFVEGGYTGLCQQVNFSLFYC